MGTHFRRCVIRVIADARSICRDISVFLHGDRVCERGLLCSLVGLGRRACLPSRSFYDKGKEWRDWEGLRQDPREGEGLGWGGLLHPLLVLPRPHPPSLGTQLLKYQPLVSRTGHTMVVIPQTL